MHIIRPLFIFLVIISRFKLIFANIFLICFIFFANYLFISQDSNAKHTINEPKIHLFVFVCLNDSFPNYVLNLLKQLVLQILQVLLDGSKIIHDIFPKYVIILLKQLKFADVSLWRCQIVAHKPNQGQRNMVTAQNR